MLKGRNNSKGITLIALIVTIIILLILAGVTINFLIGENGLISRAKEAKFKQEMKEYQDIVATYVMSNDILQYLDGDTKVINAGVHSENPNIDIKEVIPNLKDEYKSKVEIENNEFEYVPINKKDQSTKQEVEWCFEVNIKVKGYDSYEEYLEGIVEIPDGKYTRRKWSVVLRTRFNRLQCR